MNSLGNYPEPQHFLHSLKNVILFCAELINDSHVNLYHHQAFSSNDDEKIYSLESEETVTLYGEEENFTIQHFVLWSKSNKSNTL